MKKTISLYLLFIIVILGCRAQGSDINNPDRTFTVENAISDGGKFGAVQVAGNRKFLNSIMDKTTNKLSLKSNEIALLDVFVNNKYYVWYVGSMSQGMFFRLSSDYSFDPIESKEINPANVKAELKLIRGE